MIKNNRNNEQIYGRNDMIMLDQNNKIYGSLGLADNYVMKTEEGTRLMLSNPKQGKFADVLTEFNMYGRSEQKQYSGKNLLKYPYVETTKTYSGITFTDNKDGSINVSGTATDASYYNFYSNIDGKRLTLASGTYKLVVKGRSKCNVVANNGVNSVTNEGTLTITDAHNAIYCYIAVQKGVTVDETIYPMIQLASITDESYEPYTGGKQSPNPDYPQEIKSVVNPIVKVTNEDETESQTVTLPYTLNAIPVSSGGNVTIGEQQYISDYADIEKGKLYRKVKQLNLKDVDDISVAHGFHSNGNGYLSFSVENISKEHQPISNRYRGSQWTQTSGYVYIPNSNIIVFVDDRFTDRQTAIKLVQDTYVIYALSSQIETDLTPEEIQAYKNLVTYAGTTIVENNYNTWMKATYKSTESV